MVIVRETRIEDVDAILRIRQEPGVAAFQYRLDPGEYAELLRRVLAGENQFGVTTKRYSTIDFHDEVVGYICHDHYCIDNTNMVACAWNLKVACWGLGIMRICLTQLLNLWILDLEVKHVFADHFRKNQRCQSLLDRMGFVTQEIPVAERVTNACRMRCLHWIVRRRLDAQVWKISTAANK